MCRETTTTYVFTWTEQGDFSARIQYFAREYLLISDTVYNALVSIAPSDSNHYMQMRVFWSH